jgi:UDP-glucose 4-epimerase
MIRQERKSYLVTGGCGFIGSNLVDKLLDFGHHVIVIDDLSSGKTSNLSTKAELIIGDIRDQELVETLMLRVEGCFHLAAIVSVEHSNKEWFKSSSVNLGGTIQIFNAAKKGLNDLPIPVVYASSAATYGNNSHYPLNEALLVSPLNAYGADKLACELHALVAWEVFQIPTMGFRFFNVYGLRSDPNSMYSGVISKFIDSIRQSKPITINGDGNQTRDFTYVKDVVSFLYQGMQTLMREQFIGQVYNVCTGHETSVKQLSEFIGEIINNTVETLYAKPRCGDIYRSLGCPLKAKHDLQQEAKYNLKAGLTDYLNALKD